MTLHRFPTPGFWPRYGVTLRPWLCVVSGAAGLVGLALAPELAVGTLWVGLALFLATYGLGQALTDTTQTDTDALSAPERPLVRGELALADVRAVSLAGLLVCAAGFAWLNPLTLLPSAVAVGGLVTYTWFKRRWWSGPAWNAWIVAFLVWIGALAGGAALGPSPGVRAAMASTFFGYAVFVILGYLKDVEADRATGYVTLPVRFGRRVAVLVSAAAGVASLACSAWLVADARPNALSVGLAALGVAALLLAHLRAWRSGGDADAHPAIVASVVSFVVLRAAEVAWLRPDLLAPALLLAALVGPALALRPNREQV